MTNLHSVARVSDIPPGQGLAVDVDGRRIALFNVAGKVYAIDDECPHAGGPLSEGDLVGTRVECPWHSACFDLGTGRALCAPADDDVRTYPVQVVNGEVRLELP